MAICPTHQRWYDGMWGGCPGCEGRSIQPDQSLLAQWDAALGADIHTRNKVRCNYQYACFQGIRERVDAIETSMRATIAKKILGRS